MVLPGLAAVVLLAGPQAAGPPLRLQYHDIRTDAAGMILPWSHDDPARAYDHVVRLVWGFWPRMEKCPNGVPYYLQHQVWKPEHDPRGLGGDQIPMALSSWNLLHGYLGDPAVVASMRLLADYWLDHGMTGREARWPNLPFPYNTEVHSGRYDGDMIAGKGYLQPDKAGSFGDELVVLHKITGEPRYLAAAVGIADTLAATSSRAPPSDLPALPRPRHDRRGVRLEERAVRLHDELGGGAATVRRPGRDGEGARVEYERARRLVGAWLRAYPVKSQRWGPFFEDINIYSDTQINAGTVALYVLENPGWMEDGVATVRRILDGVTPPSATPSGRDTAFSPPTSRRPTRCRKQPHLAQASLELMWAEAAGDDSRRAEAIRNLSWATYMVDTDGKNRYYRDDIWLTDGYGDYVRHYLRAMATAPELAPADQNHLLRTSSVVRSIDYGKDAIAYEKWDAASRERLKLGAWERARSRAGR